MTSNLNMNSNFNNVLPQVNFENLSREFTQVKETITNFNFNFNINQSSSSAWLDSDPSYYVDNLLNYQPTSDPILDSLQKGFNDFLKNFSQMANQLQNSNQTNQNQNQSNTPTNTDNSSTNNNTTNTSTQSMTAKEAIETIMNHFELYDTATGGGDIDGFIGKGDLEIMAKNSGMPKLQAAAKFLLDNKAVWSNVFAHSHDKLKGLPESIAKKFRKDFLTKEGLEKALEQLKDL